MQYQLIINNIKLNFETKEEGLNALISKWYYDRFPYRWYTDMYGNTLIKDDWIGEYNHRRGPLMERLSRQLDVHGCATLDGFKLIVNE